MSRKYVVQNGVEVRMKSREQHQMAKKRLMEHNDMYNMYNLELKSRMRYIPESRRDWVETKMYELQNKASIYETAAASVLLDHNIIFLHQAPFSIHGKLYFLDFYIPSIRTAIEIDGKSHHSEEARNYDRQRDIDFKSIGIKSIRIKNGCAHSIDIFESILIKQGIISKNDKLYNPVIKNKNKETVNTKRKK